MRSIASETEWLACDQPQELAYFARGRLDVQRFRWLAVDWGSRIQRLFEPNDLLWFEAFAQWVAGAGPHPAEVCQQHPGFYPFGGPHSPSVLASLCADALRRDDPLSAAANAGASASEDYPLFPLPQPDFAHAHRGRAKAKRAADKARTDAYREAWWAAKAEHGVRVRQEFCDQFRDVAGNPFRPTPIRPEWRTSTVVALARDIGTELAFNWLPILADALLDAGCEDTSLLDHCRGAGPHVRGCWVLELLAEG